jgi:DNA-binding NarL/FixJ family response regulator
MRPVRIPGGIEDNSLEIFIHNGELEVHYMKSTIPFEKLPEHLKDAFSQHMLANKAALKSLHDDFNLHDASDMLIQYIKCNFGNYDFVPDMDSEGTIYPECWNCGKRGTCPGEGKVCGRIRGPKGLLSKCETEIFFMVVDGKFDKEIASFYDKSLATVITQLSDIRLKLDCNNRIEIMNYAIRRKLINI